MIEFEQDSLHPQLLSPTPLAAWTQIQTYTNTDLFFKKKNPFAAASNSDTEIP